jgi:hypothetical protein
MMLHFKDGRACFFDKAVPCTAIVALSLPTGRDAPAFLTDITAFCFGHARSLARTKGERKGLVAAKKAEKVDKVDTKDEASLRLNIVSDIDFIYM